ncbi:MAG TPA: alpha/beta fold hydrolase [Noviherbaspirillum sp.]|jgi:triacylglycerol esterase/lipase EstA (alpha/beta hydrolase family)|uniref:esterase/lipase family protein n=1 Tax=Noviherbaspirillum sp. TaxID=1926288 RepID=UPI002F95DD78
MLLLQALVAAALAWLFAFLLPAAGGWLATALGLACVLGVRAAINANNFLIASRFRSHLPAHFRIRGIAFLRLFLAEFRASMVSSSWSMPFLAFERCLPEDAEGLPVLLVHGYGCNSGYWRAMSRALQRARVAHHAVNLEPVTASIDDYVAQVHAGVERLRKETGSRRVILLCHSMGGLVARAYIRVHGTGRLARVITLGTPHHGTALAHFGVGLNSHQMRWTASEQGGLASEWLREIAAGEDIRTYRLFVSIWSHHDNIISPQSSSRLEGARNIELHAVGHVALAMDKQVQKLVVEEIRAASAIPLP